MVSGSEKVNRLALWTNSTLNLLGGCNRLKNDQSEKGQAIMRKITCICLLLLGLAACSSQNDSNSKQVSAQGINDGSNDPYYQLQESEAKKHKDSAPPVNQ
jgi:hypothetical protein